MLHKSSDRLRLHSPTITCPAHPPFRLLWKQLCLLSFSSYFFTFFFFCRFIFLSQLLVIFIKPYNHSYLSVLSHHIFTMYSSSWYPPTTSDWYNVYFDLMKFNNKVYKRATFSFSFSLSFPLILKWNKWKNKLNSCYKI